MKYCIKAPVSEKKKCETDCTEDPEQTKLICGGKSSHRYGLRWRWELKGKLPKEYCKENSNGLCLEKSFGYPNIYTCQMHMIKIYAFYCKVYVKCV
jgi:hypothetical protein